MCRLPSLPRCLWAAVASLATTWAAAQPLALSCAVDSALVQGTTLSLHAWATNAEGRAVDLPAGLRWQVDRGTVAEGPVVAGEAGRWILPAQPRSGRLQAQLLDEGGRSLCTVTARRVPGVRGAGPSAHGLVGAREFLTRDATAPGGHAAQAFLLLPAPPAPSERERCIRVLSAWLRQLQPAAEMEQLVERDRITLFLLPLRQMPPAGVLERLENPSDLRRAAEGLLAVYDHARAQALLAQLGVTRPGPGPLLVTRHSPPQGDPQVQLVEDFTRVDPAIAEAWMNWSVSLVSQPREPSAEALRRVAMTLRNVIAHIARSLPDGGAGATAAIQLAAVTPR